jgi:hypothetical protein
VGIVLKPGTRLFSTVCATEMIVVRAPAEPVELTIGGEPPATNPAERTGGIIRDGLATGVAMGKRYVDASNSVELLCTKPGDGVPAVDGVALSLKEAKPLPSSD